MIQAPSFVARAILASAALHVSVAVVMTRGDHRGVDLGSPGQTIEIYTLENPEAPADPPLPEAPVPPPVVPAPNVAIPVAHPPAIAATPAAVPRGAPTATGAGLAQGETPVTPEAPAVAASSDAPARFVMSLGGAATTYGAVSSAGASTPGGGDGRGAALGDPDATYAESGVSTPARLRVGAPPDYPSLARRDGVEGDVPLEIVVNAQGGVVDARPLGRAGHGLDEAALAAVKSYRFSPAERDGRRVRVRMRWVVQFRLD